MPDDPSVHIADIRAASRHLVRALGFLDRTIAGTDMSASAVHAILEIGLTPGVTAKDLSVRLKLEKSTISRLLKGLARRGAIAFSQVETDRRAQALSLTDHGWALFREIDAYGNRQVGSALEQMTGTTATNVARVLEAYAAALDSGPRAVPPVAGPTIVEGYRTGMIGDIAALHARTHGPIVGNGPAFESVVSSAMAEFMPRIGDPRNNSWSVLENGAVTGSITIDGEDLGANTAHLRWFILSEKLRGKGLGRALLDRALAHCDTLGFDTIHLWTLKGLDAARALYEKSGFELADEYIGDQWGKAVTEQKFIRNRPV